MTIDMSQGQMRLDNLRESTREKIVSHMVQYVSYMYLAHA